MIKFYIPDGHLEQPVVDLFARAGFKIRVRERAYAPEIDDKSITLKRIRPQDFPFIIALGKGDLAITGTDIIKEFRLRNPKYGKNIVELLDLGLGKTKLCVAVSKDVMPHVRTVNDLAEYSRKKRELIVATEYPNIAADYLKRKKIRAIIRKPAGKTEAWIIPPDPEADVVVDITETGRTLRENRCVVLDVVMEASAHVIANRNSLRDPSKKRKIEEIVKLFKGALEAEGKVNVYMNVNNPKDLRDVLKVLSPYVKKPTVSELWGGGYDIFIVIDEKELKYILPKLVQEGASSIATSDTRMIIK